jgi:hypothetical protein
LSGQGHATSPMTRRCAITRVIACIRGSGRNLVCDNGTNLDGYSVMADIDDFSMVIITLGHLYSMSYRFASPDVCLHRAGNVQTVGYGHLGWDISHRGVVFKAL